MSWPQLCISGHASEFIKPVGTGSPLPGDVWFTLDGEKIAENIDSSG